MTPPKPTVSGVNPGNGPAVGGTAVTVSGSGFKEGAKLAAKPATKARSRGGK